MRNTIKVLLGCLAIYCGNANAQCDLSVPSYTIDLSANPDSTWTLLEVDALPRLGQCCSASGSDECIQFVVTLHPDAAGMFFDYDGAAGSLVWQVDCGPLYDLNDTVCVVDPGPFVLTFCKPGNDLGSYSFTSVPAPILPDPQFVPLNCVYDIELLGMDTNTIVWQSISPGTPGQYNNLLSCTDCPNVTFTPDGSGTTYEFEMCGEGILKGCPGGSSICDTVFFTVQDSVLLTLSPENPEFCAGGSVDLTASATGGDGNYSFIWYDGTMSEVGTGAVYTASIADTYTCEVRDGNFLSGTCGGFFESIDVTEASQPIATVSAAQLLCASDPLASVSGVVQFADSGEWTGGAGTYSPSNTDANITYLPTTAELLSGSVMLTYTSIGGGASCVSASDNLVLSYLDTIKTTLADITLSCFGDTELVAPVVSGGLAPYDYTWSDASTNTTNTLGAGGYCLTIDDAHGCQSTDCFTIYTPADLTESISPSIYASGDNISCNGISDGTLDITINGGVVGYSYAWSTLDGSGLVPSAEDQSGLTAGTYDVVQD
jgi:hypothetical protein